MTTIACDAAGRRTGLTLPTGTSVTYAYDAASQLTSLTYKQGATTIGDLTYTYDAAGNRLKQGGLFARSTIPPALTTVSYNANNQQTTFGTNTETYDFNGNLATVSDASGTATYSWNVRNQLTGISAPGFAASFTYDSFGRRTGKTVQGVLTNFVYDGVNPVQEKSGATVTANLLTGLGIDEFFTRTDGVGTRSLLPDALGSTVALGNNTGTLQTQYTYEPFGYATQSGQANSNSYKYTGREDDGSGLYYYRARYYHPRLQRFIAEDPLGIKGGDINLYAYVRNAPPKYIDPTGLMLPQDHGNLTVGVATVCGLSTDDAFAIANANMSMDTDHLFETLSPSSPKHYMPGTNLEAEAYIESQLNQASISVRNGDIAGSLTHLGQGLHTRQDGYFHAFGDPPGTMGQHVRGKLGGIDPDDPGQHPDAWHAAEVRTRIAIIDYMRARGLKPNCQQ